MGEEKISARSVERSPDSRGITAPRQADRPEVRIVLANVVKSQPPTNRIRLPRLRFRTTGAAVAWPSNTTHRMSAACLDIEVQFADKVGPQCVCDSIGMLGVFKLNV